MEAAYKTILVIAGDKELKKIKMQTMWNLLEVCIKPIITYAAETWETTKKENKAINGIYDKIIKRVLKLPTSTPREVLYLETKIIDIEHTNEKNQIMMLHRLQKTQNQLLTPILNNQENRAWAQKTKQLMTKYTEEDLLKMSTHTAKQLLKKRTKKKNQEDMTTAGSEKSKVKFYIENRTNNEKRPTYLDILTRSEVSTIFRARTRMFNVKTNYKNKYKDTTCRG